MHSSDHVICDHFVKFLFVYVLDGRASWGFYDVKLTLADLSLKETLKVAAPIFSISEPPYPLKTLLNGRMVIGKGKSWRSVVVITHVSAQVSTLKLMLWCLLILTLA